MAGFLNPDWYMDVPPFLRRLRPPPVPPSRAYSEDDFDMPLSERDVRNIMMWLGWYRVHWNSALEARERGDFQTMLTSEILAARMAKAAQAFCAEAGGRAATLDAFLAQEKAAARR